MAMSDRKDPQNTSDPSVDSCWRLVSRVPEKYGDTPDAPGDTPAHGYQEAQMSLLVNTIEAEIIPRLIANHGGAASIEAPVSSYNIAQSEVQSFTRVALANDAASCRNFVEAVRIRGVNLRSVYLGLLGPAARELGAMWTRDECDFTEVTTALWRIQQVMYDLSPEFHDGVGEESGKTRQIMLVPVPGSQHTLGILMVAEFFRKAGWRVWGEPLARAEDMIAAVAQQHFDVLGLSVGSEPDRKSVV